MACEFCNDTKFIPVDKTTVRVCVCAYASALRTHLGPDIASAKTIQSSPLLSLGPSSVDLTQSNVFIRGHWDVVRSHLKWALAYRGLRFRFRVVTDESLKNVYLGGESYASRSKKTRDEKESYNNLPAFIGEDLDLAIIRVGFLGWHNKAMPGILKEALMIRDGLRLPTWVVEDTTNPFKDTVSYSFEVEEFLKTKYKEVLLGEANPDAVKVGIGKSDLDPERVESSFYVERPSKTRTVSKKHAKSSEGQSDDGDAGLLGSFGQGGKKSFKNFR